jgi:DNA-binding transcriptional LysR family regulator
LSDVSDTAARRHPRVRGRRAHGNFSRAGEELAMTQAAVSYQMKVLEERLGAPLFVRQGRGMALTDLGRRIAPQVHEAFQLLDKAFAAARPRATRSSASPPRAPSPPTGSPANWANSTLRAPISPCGST